MRRTIGGALTRLVHTEGNFGKKRNADEWLDIVGHVASCVSEMGPCGNDLLT
jgi:hypothetical protein